MRLETDRLIITEFTMDMARDVHENSLDEDNRRFVPDEVFETEEDAAETLAFLISQYSGTDGPQAFPVFTRDSGENIGYVQLAPLEDGVWEIGYHIAKKHTGKGYATEAVRAFLPFAAARTGIDEILGVCLSENAASKHVLRKCGFDPVFEGTGEYQGEQREVFRSVWKKDACRQTLYVSDLDKTLMRSDATLSDFTVETVNSLVSRGLAFTYATARSIQSARTIAGGLKLALPVVTRNGAVLADNSTGRILEKAVFTEDEVRMLKELLPELPACGFVSCFLGDEMIKTFMAGQHTRGLEGYLEYYREDPAMVQAFDLDGLFCGQPGYVTLIGDREYIAPLAERVSKYPGWECLFQKDSYREEEYWLEICPRNCTKAKSLLKLKEQYGFRKLVVFGDSLNDLTMFRSADEAYAVSNAMDELKAAATGVIGSNDEDAVALFLRRRAEESML